MLLRHALPTRGLVIAGVVAVGLVLAIPLITAGQGTVLEIDAERDITIVGVDPSDLSGTDVATGDLNDDGVIDIVIGAHFADPPLRTDAGETYVVFGPVATGTQELSSVADVIVQGIDVADFSGGDASTGDLNAAGIADLIIGAPLADVGANPDAGETYVIFGPLSAGTLDLAASPPDVTITGVLFTDNSRIGVSSGDLDNDGADDLIVGAELADPPGASGAGKTYVLFGPLATGTRALTGADITINGTNIGDHSGIGVDGGDVDGDGIADLIIGAHHADPGGRTDAGQVYVLHGPLAAGTLDLSTAPDLILNGIAAGDVAGRGLADWRRERRRRD